MFLFEIEKKGYEVEAVAAFIAVCRLVSLAGALMFAFSVVFFAVAFLGANFFFSAGFFSASFFSVGFFSAGLLSVDFLSAARVATAASSL